MNTEQDDTLVDREFIISGTLTSRDPEMFKLRDWFRKLFEYVECHLYSVWFLAHKSVFPMKSDYQNVITINYHFLPVMFELYRKSATQVIPVSEHLKLWSPLLSRYWW